MIRSKIIRVSSDFDNFLIDFTNSLGLDSNNDPISKVKASEILTKKIRNGGFNFEGLL